MRAEKEKQMGNWRILGYFGHKSAGRFDPKARKFHCIQFSWKIPL